MSGSWEIDNPLAFINGSKEEYLDTLLRDKLYNASGIVLRGALVAACAFGLGWASYKLLGRFKQYVMRKIRERFANEDRAQ